MSREDVIRGIVRRELEGGSLAEEAVARDAPELHQAACTQFGAWATALHYAGVRVYWPRGRDADTPEDVLRTIRALCRRGGSLKAEKNRRIRRRLYEAAKRHFGTWRRALGAAGIDLRHANLRAAPRSLDRDEILAALRERHRAGETLRWGEVVLENRAFAMAARHAFGNWRAAMAAAGIVAAPVPTAQRKWDRQRVIAAIQERQQAGKSLRYSAVRAEAGGLIAAAKTYLGGWTKALAAAGVAVERLPSGRRPRPQP
jgi:hypothetical protein